MVSDVLACIEVGGSGAQTVRFRPDGSWTVADGAHADDVAVLAIAVPGIVALGRVVAASNLDWFDVDPAAQLGLPTAATTVLNDGEAAALGEADLRGAGDLTFVCLGTGVGGAVVRDGEIVGDNLFGHARPFSTTTCTCGSVGCLETVAAGWALPDPLPAGRIGAVADAVAGAIRAEPLATTDLVVVGGGLARRHPVIVDALAHRLRDRTVERSAAPEGTKSAAAWGLRRVVEAGARR